MAVKIRRVDAILSAPLDQTLLMMSVEQGLYFEARGAGPRIWELLAEPITEEALVAALLDQFDVTQEACAAETAAFMQALKANGMVVEVDESVPCG